MKNLQNLILKNENVVKIAFAIAILVLLVFVIKKFFLKSKEEKQEEKRQESETQERKQDVKTGVLTYPLSTYKSFAEQLYKAMDGAGTDNNTIYNVFNQLITHADLSQTVLDYGYRHLHLLFGVRETSAPLGLFAALSDELGFIEKPKLNKILAQKGFPERV